MSIFSDIKKAFSRIGDLGKKVDHVVDDIEDFGGDVKSLAKKVRSLDSEFKKLPKTLKNQTKNAVEEVLQTLVSESIKPGLKAQAKLARAFAESMDRVAKKSPTLVDEINKAGFDVELSANVKVSLEYKNFWQRARVTADILDRYGRKGVQLRRKAIREFIMALGPDTISFGAGVSFSLGLDIGGTAKIKSISMPLFLELADYVMEEAGIPE